MNGCSLWMWFIFHLDDSGSKYKSEPIDVQGVSRGKVKILGSDSTTKNKKKSLTKIGLKAFLVRFNFKSEMNVSKNSRS